MPKTPRSERAPSDQDRQKTFQVIAQGLKRTPALLFVFGIGLVGVALLGVNAFSKPDALQLKLSFAAFVVLVGLAVAALFLMRGQHGSAGAAETNDVVSAFRSQIIGDWWEQITLVRKADGSEAPSDRMSSLSHVTIKPDDTTGHITLRATGYNRQGERAADWDSDVAVIKGDKVFYFWTGRHTSKGNTPEEREGFGQFTFEGGVGNGKFVDLDVGLQKLSTADTKIVELVRCTREEVAVLKSHDPSSISKLVESKLSKTKAATSIAS